MYKLPNTQIRREGFAPATETAEIRSVGVIDWLLDHRRITSHRTVSHA
jgi:hypothetical protein